MGQNAQSDLQRLIFATANVRYLRGLSMLPSGLLLVALPLLGHLAKMQPSIALAGLLAGIAGVIFFTVRINQYYDDHYGRVEPGTWKQFPALGLAVWGGVAAVLISTGRDTETTLWIAAFFWGIYMSSSGYRWFYLAAAVAFACIGPFWGDLGDQWKSAALGIAFAVTGLMDHLLLHRLLPSPSDEKATPGVS